MDRKLAVIVALTVAFSTLAGAQRGGTMHIPHRLPAQPYDQALIATDNQRTSLQQCMENTDRLRAVANRMPRIGSPWIRSRLSYTTSDVSALSNLTEQFEAALTDLIATHKAFREELTDAQRTRLERRLRKLEHLESKMDSDATELDRDLAKAKPGPASPNIAWEVNSIKSAVDKWRSEHRKIAKEMGVHA